MSNLSKAYEYEEIDDPISAIKYYEKAFYSDEGIFEDYINAAVLLFICQDYGYSYKRKLPKEFLDQAWDLSIKFLDLANDKFGNNFEIEFWRKYFAFILLGEMSFVDECKKYLDNGVVVSCIHLLFALKDEDLYLSKCKNLVSDLYEKAKIGKTAKDKYIKSLLSR